MVRRPPNAEELPRDLYVEVTNRCNSHCQTCIRTFERLEPLRDLTLPEFQAIVDQFEHLDRVVLHGIGEPLLNAELPAMIRYAKSSHPSTTVLFNSNAILLDEGWQAALVDAGLDQYRISLDAASADTYARIRGVDAFDTVVRNIRGFSRSLRGVERPRLSLWIMAMRENLGELPALVDLAANVGVPEAYVQRLVLFHRGLAREAQSLYGQVRAKEETALAQAAKRAQAHGLVFRASGLVAPRESLQGQNGRDAPYSACYRLWTTTYITANGNVLPCCISPFSTTDYVGLILGNIHKSSFEQIWNGEKYVSRREALYTAHPLHPCEQCGVCWSL